MAEYGPFGPPYQKINSAFKRDTTRRNVIIPDQWAQPEFGFLSDVDWVWTEKCDGTNVRLRWDGSSVTIGGRTDNATMPAKLVANLQESITGPALDLWIKQFDATPATLYGEGIGAGIQNGGLYSAEQTFVLFDVRIGNTWLERHSVEEIGTNLGFNLVPVVATCSLSDAVDWIADPAGTFESPLWPEATPEGIVGRPKVDLLDRRGSRIVTKLKYKDFADLRKFS